MSRHIEITTYIGCPNMCDYCPQELLIKSYKGNLKMGLDKFKKILSNIPKDVDIHFSGFSEIFFNSQAVDFIKEAMKEHQVVVYTTTKGMTDEMYNQIKDLPFKEFHIHNRGGRNIPFATDTITINNSNKISRGGNLWKTEKEGKYCSKSSNHEQNVVLPNGDVYLCCMDYGLKHKLGNLLKQNFNDLTRFQNYELCKHCEWYA